MDNTQVTTECSMDATPVWPTSLGDTPPIGDVHTMATASTAVSNPEVSPPANFKTRQLKITDAPVGRHPGLRIHGKWLKEAGFSIGGHVRISVAWQCLLVEVLHPDCVAQRPTTREEHHLALKDRLLSRRTDFAAASHLTRSRAEAPQHGCGHMRSKEGCSLVADSADFTTTQPAVPVSKQAPDLKSGGDTWLGGQLVSRYLLIECTCSSDVIAGINLQVQEEIHHFHV
jgi:hypothetical protein